MTMTDFTITPRGPFSLGAAVHFFGSWEGATGVEAQSDTLRVAFRLDDYASTAGLLVRQAPDGGDLEVTIVTTTGDPDQAAIEAQLAAILSLDHDGTGYAELGERDPVVGGLQRQADFLRPVLFNSVYEAAVWSILSARAHHRQAQKIRSALSDKLTVDGVALDVFPAPEALLERQEVDGLSAEKVVRLHGIARAALDGDLDRATLRALDTETAQERLQELRGIGPFSAMLIAIRALGPADALVLGEARMRKALAAAYDRPELERDDAAVIALADSWRPYRTWVAVLLRATAGGAF
jgi:DNA-3-methyladenine glycosylase II